MAPEKSDPGGEEFGRAPGTVMFTDMVGYSELTQRDETGALRLLNEHRRIVRPLLAEHGGREVKTIGDAFMVEFTDPTAAVRCALAIQRRHAERNRDPTVPEVQIRIGLHSGEVIHQEGDLYGDTVNVASRIEPLSPPGGVCLSDSVYEAVHERIEVTAVPVGPATLKNIHLPVGVYRIDLRPERHVPLREGPWVDREEELARLESALATAAEGPARIVFIEGNSGLGKTRLAEQLVRASTRQGARVVWGRASNESAQAPYALWVQAIEELAADLPSETLLHAAGEFASEIQRLVPRLPFGPAPEPPAPVSDPDSDLARDRLFAGVVRLFRELAGTKPIVLFLDDLQWADSGSLRLMAHVASNGTDSRLLLLALHRPEPKGSTSVLAEVLAELVRLPQAETIVLTHLPVSSVRQLVLALVKTKAIPDGFVQQVFEKTGGNPYFVEEVIRALKDRGLLSNEPGQPFPRLPENLPVPDTVRRLARQRIERVDDEVAAFLRSLAVLGFEFGWDPLPRFTGLDQEALVDRLGTVVGLGLLVEKNDERGAVRYSFSDRPVWETLYSEMPIARRLRVHLRAGEALEALQKAGQPIPSAAIAHHFQSAQAADRALDYVLRAADEASGLFAREEAVRHYRAALVLLESRPSERTRAQVLEALGDQLYRMGHIEAGQASRQEAIACFERLGLLRESGNLHRKVAHSMREDPASARHHWEEALRLLEAGGENAELARLLVTIAGYRYEDGDTVAAAELYARAIAIARRVDDAVTQVSAQIILAGLRPARESDQVLQDLQDALAVAERQSLGDLVPNLHMVLALACLHIRGDGPAAEAALEKALVAARRTRDLHTERSIEANLVTFVAWRLGEYERAVRTVEAHLQYAAGDPRKLLPTALLVDADIALTRGDSDRAASDLDEVGALLEGGGDWSERVHLCNVRGRASLGQDRLPRAREVLRGAHELAVRAGVPALMAALHSETLLLEIEAALRARDADPARGLLATLEELDRASGQSTVRAYALRARAAIHRETGEVTASIADLQAALEIWERLGWKYEAAQCQVLLAAQYRRSGASERAEGLEALARDYLARIRAPMT